MKNSVIVVGSGLAGMVASMAACEKDADVMLIDRGSMGIGTNSALANGCFSGPFSGYSAEDYIADTLKSGRLLNYEPMVKMTAKEAPASFGLLKSLGIILDEAGTSYYMVRTPRPEIIPGIVLVKKVAEAVRRTAGIEFVGGFYVIELIKDGGRVCGVRGFDAHGNDVSIYASAVVLATGGAGAIYEMHDNQRTMMGQGYRLAAAAGTQLWDMEFVQFIPVVLAEPSTPRILLFSPYPAGTTIVNEAGEDLVEKYDIGPLNETVRKRRDYLSICLFKESRTGPVYIDYRKAADSAWGVHPLALLSAVRFDFKNRPARILPGAHFFNGGVRVDEAGRTAVPGLFACGEVVWGLHGANRRAGNALTECVVLGLATGRAAAGAAGESGFTVEKHGMPGYPAPSLPGTLRDLRGLLRKLAWEKAGVVRDRTGIEEALAEVAILRERIAAASSGDMGDRLMKEDLLSACFTLKAVIAAGLARNESRGCFNRSDYPAEDNGLWLKNSCLSFQGEGRPFSVDYYPASVDSLKQTSR